jgi:hypothetical protein
MPSATAIATTTTGSWNTGGTWVGGAVPPADANVSVLHAVTVPSGYTTPEYFNVTASADITVTGTLNFAGDLVTSAKLLGAGSVIGNPSAGATKKVQFATAHNQSNVGFFMVGASAGSPAIFRKKSGSTGTLNVSDGGFLQGGQADAQFVTVTGIGTWNYWISASGNTFRWNTCIFDACGVHAATSALSTDSIYDYNNSEFRNSTGSVNIEYQGTNSVGTGTRRLNASVFDKGVNMFGSGLSVVNAVIIGLISTTTNAAIDQTLWHDNFLYNTLDATPFSKPKGEMYRTYVCIDTPSTNPHFLQESAEITTNKVTDCIFESPSSAGVGDGVIAVAPGSAQTYEVSGCILLPNDDQESPGKIVSMLGNANYKVKIHHNTFYATLTGECGVGFGETYNGYAGMIDQLQDNIAWRYSWKTGGALLRRIGGTVQDVPVAANTSHNVGFNISTMYDGNGTAIWSGTPGGASDITSDPGFVDPDRRLAKWDLSLSSSVSQAITSITRSGTAVTVNRTAHGLVKGSWVTISGVTPTDYNGSWLIDSVPNANSFTFRISTTPANSSVHGNIVKIGSTANAIAQLKLRTSGYNPTALIDYVRGGLTPTASALDGTAHDSSDRGAVPFTAAGGTTLNLASTLCAF